MLSRPRSFCHPRPPAARTGRWAGDCTGCARCLLDKIFRPRSGPGPGAPVQLASPSLYLGWVRCGFTPRERVDAAMPRRNRSHRGSALGLGRAPHTPLDFRHHAFLRDVDGRVFDALHRSLRQRLFEGRAPRQDGARTAALHQGPSPALTRALAVGGLMGILFAALAASELGRDLRQRSQGGGVFDAAVFSFLQWMAARAFAVVAAAALGLGLWARAQGRKDVWLVALPAGEPGRIDLWVAGAASRHPGRFAVEFDALVGQAQALPPAPRTADELHAASG